MKLNTIAYFLYPGELNTRTGGYLYDKKVVDGLRAQGWTIHLRSLAGDYPFPDDAARQLALKCFADIPDNSLLIADGLALCVLPAEIKKHKERLKLVALIHHPLALEMGLSESQVHALTTSETQALELVDHVITTSQHTAETLRQFGVTGDRVSVVFPGTEKSVKSLGSVDGGFRLICVATLNKRKGHAVLINALKLIEHLPWTLVCAGSCTRDPDTYNSLVEQTQTLGLTDRITFSGELDNDELNAEYQRADAFVLASYYEGYGMVLDEAIARGLPIIATSGGAIADTVPSSAAILTSPGYVDELTEALRQYMENKTVRTQLREGACQARETLRTWQQTVTEFSTVLQSALEIEN